MGKEIFKAVDFFCGGGGMTCGLRQAGIKVLAGIDFDSAAKETYEYNNPGAKFINEDINKLETDYLEKEFRIKKEDDKMIFVGCSPCQYYSIIRSSKAKSLKTKDLLMQFVRFIEYYKPGYILVENVPGIMTNKDTILTLFLQKLDSLGYGSLDTGTCYYNIVNMNDYGIAQNRRRFSLIANRLGKKVSLPKKDKKKLTLKDAIGDKAKFPHISAGHIDSDTVRFHSTMKLTDINIQRLQHTPHNGGNRLAWKDDTDLQLTCYIGHDNSFRDVFGRMSWDKPSPTITTKFISISNGRFGHPEQNRGISIREGAALQSFPWNYCFKTESIGIAARIIGNAVPPEYGKRIGEIIING